MVELSGRCLCGELRYGVNGKVLGASHCHCESCRRATSSPVTTFFTAERSAVGFEGGTLRHYASSPGVKRGFCGSCGSPMSFETEGRPGEIDLYVASLDSGQFISIEEHWHWSERVHWLHIDDDLPKREG